MGDNLPLSLPEKTDLERLETVIEKGLSTFAEVGLALCSIRDRGLYRGTHPTFEAYCLDRWTMTRHYAYRLIAAHGVVANCQREGVEPPANEAQARPLAGMEPAAAAEALEDARETAAEEGRPVTARDIDIAAAARKAGIDQRRIADDLRGRAVGAIRSRTAGFLRSVRGEAGRLDAGEQEQVEAWLQVIEGGRPAFLDEG